MNWKLIPATVCAFGLVAGCGTNSPTSSASSTQTAAPSSSAFSSSTESACDDQRAEAAIGKKSSDSLAETYRKQSGAKIVRVLHPNSVMTTEYNPQRLNLRLDEQGVVTSVNCG